MGLRIGLLLLAVLCQVTVGAWGWAKTTQLDSARHAATQLGQQLEATRSDVERHRAIVTRLNATLNQQLHAQAEQLKRLSELRLGLAQRMQQSRLHDIQPWSSRK